MIAIEEIKDKYGVEMALVILCCRVHFKTADEIALQYYIDSNFLDWNLVLTICRNHRIRPVVYKILISMIIPEKIRNEIKQEYLDITKRNWQLAVETERIIILLEENGITALPYKGVAYSKQFYGDLISREISDIDLVIKFEDLDKVIELMEADGYLSEIKDVYEYLGSRYKKYFKEYNFNKFSNKVRQFHIEFHWGIAEYFLSVNTKVDDLFQIADHKQVIINHEILFLNSDNHFTSMMVHHSFKDMFAFLRNTVDLCEMGNVKIFEKNGNLIKKTIDGLGMQRIWGITTFLSANLFGIHEAKNLSSTDKIKKYFLDQQLIVDNFNAHSIINFRIIKNQLYLRSNSYEKFKYLSTTLSNRFIPTPPDFKLFRFSKQLFFLYYILKPFRSLVKPYNVQKEKAKLIPE